LAQQNKKIEKDHIIIQVKKSSRVHDSYHVLGVNCGVGSLMHQKKEQRERFGDLRC
jgi:hypothetical protein